MINIKEFRVDSMVLLLAIIKNSKELKKIKNGNRTVREMQKIIKILENSHSLKKLIEETKKFKNNPDVYKELKRDEELKSTISKFSQEDKDIFINLVRRSFKV